MVNSDGAALAGNLCVSDCKWFLDIYYLFHARYLHNDFYLTCEITQLLHCYNTLYYASSLHSEGYRATVLLAYQISEFLLLHLPLVKAEAYQPG